jgi:hypothetical protein
MELIVDLRSMPNLSATMKKDIDAHRRLIENAPWFYAFGSHAPARGTYKGSIRAYEISIRIT